MQENQKISIPFSESDIRDLQNGESFDWTFGTEDGQMIDVYLFKGECCDDCGEEVEDLNEVETDEGETKQVCSDCYDKTMSKS